MKDTLVPTSIFAKDKKSASARLKNLCETEPEHRKLYCNKKVRLAKKQVSHMARWKTWEIVRK